MKTDQKILLSEIESLLTKNNRFFLSSHVYPDGDNIGSLIAMKILLDQMGKSSYVYCETVVPKIYKWLEETRFINMNLPSKSCSDFDLIVTLDASDIARLGRKFSVWYSTESVPILNIDHHVTNTQFGDLNWASGGYASTGEQVYELAKFMKVKITKQMAVALYTSIATDTGRFSYANTTSRSLKYASELVDFGANPNQVYRNVYGSRSLTALKLERDTLATLQYIEDLKLAVVHMTQDMVKQSGASVEESEGIIEHIGSFGESIRNIMFFKEISPGEVKVSVRTKDNWDASKISLLFGGGGHPRAGGFQIYEPIDKAVELSIKTIRTALNENPDIILNK